MSTEILRRLGHTHSPTASSSSASVSGDPSDRRRPNELARQDSLSPSERHFRNLTRSYIVNQLRRHGYNRLADEINDYEESDEESTRVLHTITAQLAVERETQFEDILYRLQLTDANLQVTYHTVVTEIFRDDINWGRIVAFLAFSGSLAVYCAQNRMSARVHDIVEWTEAQMHGQLRGWIQAKGGWKAFVEHFDDGSMTIDMSSLLVAGGVLAAVVAGGAFLIRKLF